MPAIFYHKHFPNGASHCPQESCGFSIYQGVLVQWDEDHDERILRVLDRMNKTIREQLVITQEHEGSISFVWKQSVPPGYKQGGSVDGDGDEWYIIESRPL